MTDLIGGTLDALAPAQPFDPADWKDVLSRAGVSQRRKLVSRRTLVVAAIIAAGVLIPLGAVGASNDWWFMRFPIIGETASTNTGTTSTPANTSSTPPVVTSPAQPMPLSPAAAPVLVKSGEWNGKGWELDAFLAASGDLCFGVSPTASAHGNGSGAGLACARVYGTPVPYGAGQTPLPLDITYLMSTGWSGFPPYIAGPVIATAHTVEIDLSDGSTVQTETFDAPRTLGSIRFYAAQLPASLASRKAGDTSPVFSKLVARDESGQVVACFGSPYGPLPLSACSP